MPEVAAVSALGVTVALVLSRPQIGGRMRVGPALAAAAGVLLMVVAGHVGPADAIEAAEVLWRPLVAITSIMVTAAAAQHLGTIDRMARSIFPYAHGSTTRLYLLVFALSAATAAALNNDSAVLALTPLVVVLIRRLYPERPGLVVPFVFAVFMAAGVAPLVTSNPMNLIVADYAGLDFNAYAARMAPVALAGWVVTFAVLRWVFHRELGAAPVADAAVGDPRPWGSAERHGLLLAAGVLGAYPIVSYLGGSVWLVAAGGACLGVALCHWHRVASPREVVVSGVAWEILAFLLGVFTLAIGLRNAGAVDWLTSLYAESGIGVIAAISAVGSAVINNHSMALTNLLAIEATSGSDEREFLAALVGGDLGPRLLPIGSLAGLLWFVSLQRLGVTVSMRQFVAVGGLVTVPTLAVSVGVLYLVL